ncbi:MAG: hypothetical protein A2086_03255 [Spirochaetes bacterium GWD1_27_9]|nr:MAG: hypothetical protein A2Z98_12930 [Spirochaetes bacterium GWB1_27_13]OHD26842.1 MAG: hypothetical protein A2Y34_15755 [Spirochaetes bacterium GWC1_27_15]OHD38715.1 MAG: hypothetical protein A2086_03255 [Spirochaetes bacterium GWD1_27_9]
MEIIKGSEWRKWDLHAHTPNDLEWNNKPDLSTKELRQDFSRKYISFAKKNEISVIGITDHNFCDNLESSLLPYIIDEAKKENITILPGFEITAKDGSGIHLLIIFPENTDLTKIKKIVDRLFNIGNDNSLNNKAIHVCDKTIDEINKIIIESKSQAIYIFAHADRDNGILDKGTITGERRVQEWQKDFIRICQLSKSPNEFSESCFISKVVNKIDEHYKKDMVYIIASDCRSISTTGNEDGRNYLGEKFTWIKADATFEGLKQILHEPESRVRIQQDKPERKNDYQVIKRVRFLDTRTKKEFSDEWINLNHNLNSIIGGKSSGKSLLLYHIAKTIDPDRINEINKDKVYQNIAYTLENDPNFNFEIEWNDGEKYCLKDANRRSSPITYIPQLYLNRLADADDKKKELNALIEDMLRDSHSDYKEFREAISVEISETRDNLNKSISEYFRIHDNLIQKQKELKELGDRKAIENAVKEIDGNILILRKESEFSEDEEKEYKVLIDKKEKTVTDLTQQEKYIKSLNDLQNRLNDYIKNIKGTLHIDIFDKVIKNDLTLTDDIKNNLNSLFDLILIDLIKSGSESINKHFKLMKTENEKREKLLTEKEEIEDKLKPYQAKVSNQELFSELDKRKKEEQIKLNAIIQKEKEIEELKKQKNYDLFFRYYQDLFNSYNKIIEKNSLYSDIRDTENLKLSSTIHFNNDKFFDNFSNKINKRAGLSNQFENIFDYNNNFIFNTENHINNIKLIITNVLEDKVKINSSYQVKDIIIALLDDYFYIDYNLIQDSDDLLKMSPGKRGIILFQLFLHLSKSTDPILIDQPEDNLDNRTVYNELNDFIKTKKSKRQIIIVSHNPNLVVSTDSENVIVANQDGQNKSGKNKNYKFEYINGSLENSFVNDTEIGILYQKGIREHVCEILEGGKEAFAKREKKYGFT